MAHSIDKSWHLANNELEITLTEFELLLWRAYAAFARWQIDAINCFSKYELTASDVAILHLVRMRDRPKTAFDVAKLLNRDDISNIFYSLRKLVKCGLIKKAKSKPGSKIKQKKIASYEITEQGIAETDTYAEIRQRILIEQLKELVQQGVDLKPATKILSTMTALYDESSRLATTYQT